MLKESMTVVKLVDLKVLKKDSMMGTLRVEHLVDNSVQSLVETLDLETANQTKMRLV